MTEESEKLDKELAAQPATDQVSLALKEREECKKQAEEYLNNWKRERADFINYKKDETKRMEEFLKFSTEGMMTELIDVIDGIEVARNNLPDSKELKEWTDGFNSSLDELDKFLKKFGVEKINVADGPSTSSGQVKFDPLLHEAVAVSSDLSSEGLPKEEALNEGREVQDKDGEKMEEIRSGYTMHGKVIRPARVKIIK